MARFTTTKRFKKRLKKRINAVIAPYAESEEEPPFTAQELFVMALLSNDCSMNTKSILRWTFDNFQYCRDLAFASFDDTSSHQDRMPGKEFRARLRRVPQDFELPLEAGRPLHYRDGSGSSKYYHISVANGERVLTTVLGIRKGKGAFPFFRLPAELRNVVYEMVFRYPDSGLILVPAVKKAVVVAKSDGYGYAVEDSDDGTHQKFTRPIKDILSPLRLSRQFHDEAMPFFYNVNDFVFINPWNMVGVLHKIPASHREHIRHITVTYRPGYNYNAAAAFTRLSWLGGLRSLEIFLDEKAFIRDAKRKGNKRTGAMQMPGVPALNKVRGLESVTFHGCPTIEEVLKRKMLKPKPALKPKLTTKAGKG